MKAPPPGTILCPFEDISDPGAIGIDRQGGIGVILIRRGNILRAYINSCPHQGTPLETFPDRFLTRDGKELLCSTHGARFRIKDGLCTSGPCKGQALQQLAVANENGIIRITGKS